MTRTIDATDQTRVWPDKDPDAVLDYRIDWFKALDGDTIGTSTWTVPAGITEDSSTTDAAEAIIWLSGGTTKTAYTLTNRIVTAAGRTFDRSVRLRVLTQ